MPPEGRKPLYYTFANHMHWVDMQWLWGYGVLPGSVRDMLRLCRETGARGNVNFDAVGYEKLAAEDPTAFAELRDAVRAGTIEVVGASYGQPYGLFQGGESNVRQRVVGARTVTRLFGRRPRGFWEEEFDFFPQLPQILRGCGFEAAGLFFQWTWHTPHVPEERCALVQWEGLDGTRLPALPKNELCLHQWPEDFEGRLDSELVRALEQPALAQWVELLPSPDWMCRAEVLLPRLRELFADERFELRSLPLTELVRELDDGRAPVRRYSMDEVFHGVSLGKNGDAVPRMSRAAERELLAAEAAASLAGLFGRPYPHWDVYPTWELEEAWRELLAAQHHDNHECEGLCGAIGKTSFQRSAALSGGVLERTVDHLAWRARREEDSFVVFNPLGWSRDLVIDHPLPCVVRDVPAFGYRVVEEDVELVEPADLEGWGPRLKLARGALAAEIDGDKGLVTQLYTPQFPDGLLAPGRPLGGVTWEGLPPERRPVGVELGEQEAGLQFVWFDAQEEPLLELWVELHPLHDALALQFVALDLPRPACGVAGSFRTALAPALREPRLVADHPYGLSEVRAPGSYLRKYPSGEWMTSEQWFERVERPLHATSLVDLRDAEDPERNVLVVHDGSAMFLAREHGVECVLSLYDPWDEDHWDGTLDARLWVLPHRRRTNAELWRVAQELTHDGFTPLGVAGERALPEGVPLLPERFGAIEVDGSGVVATAFHREDGERNAQFEGSFGRGVREPFVLRLVELDGAHQSVRVRVPGLVARAARTNLLGEVERELEARPLPPTDASTWLARAELELELRPHEIATLYLDLVPGRQVPRDLDRHRHVWATVHRNGSPPGRTPA